MIRHEIDFDRLSARADEYRQVINDRAATWGIDFKGGSCVVSVSDAAQVLARYTLETKAIRPAGIGVTVALSEVTPEATCECGNRSFGDSINDALLAWAKHVTVASPCRAKL